LVQVSDKQFDVFLSEEEILREVRSLAWRISEDYRDKEVLFIVLLNGAFMFAADLLKEIQVPAAVSFVKLSSYHGGTESSGKVQELIGLNETLEGKNVVIIEDIVDTGTTMDNLIPIVYEKLPASVKICTLLYKPEAFKGNFLPDYVGFSISNAFVVGYGLDYNGLGRNLKAIYQLKK
jgi:hypoxanthine phosphoribosyltransferase